MYVVVWNHNNKGDYLFSLDIPTVERAIEELADLTCEMVKDTQVTRIEFNREALTLELTNETGLSVYRVVEKESGK